MAANATFSDTINFTCSGRACGATLHGESLIRGSCCRRHRVRIAGEVVSATTPTTARNTQPKPHPETSGITSLASIFCLVAGWKFRKRVLLIVPIVLLGFSALGMTGCTNGGSGIAAAKPGTTYADCYGSTGNQPLTAAQTTAIQLTVQLDSNTLYGRAAILFRNGRGRSRFLF